MNPPPKPTLSKPPPPPPLNAQHHQTFTYEPDQKEPSLDDTNPLAAKALHVIMVTFLITLGGALLMLRSDGGIGWLLILILFGVSYGVYSANKDTP